MTFLEDLADKISGDIATDSETLASHSHDKSAFQVTPEAVIFPQDVRDVQEVVRMVAAAKPTNPGLSVTARSGGTDVTGGPLNDSLILDFTRYCNHIISVGDGAATAEPGVYYRDFEHATLAKNLLLPSFPASRSICALGGMVANNSGGEKTLAFGKTENFVTQLKVVMSDGNEYVIEPLDEAQLKNKLALKSFEGNFYRQIHALVMNNFDVLQRAKPRVQKNSAGYYLWNVWNAETKIFDLTQLFVGSQGTLGIITEMSFRLIKPAEQSQMLAIFLDNISQIPDVVHTVLRHKPETFEMYDRSVLKIIFKYFPQFVSLMGRNIFKLLKDFLPEIKIILSSFRLPAYILIAEFTGNDVAEISRRTRTVAYELKQHGVTTHITTSEGEAQKYRTIRRESFAVLQKHSAGRQTVTFIDDLIVQPEQLPEFIPQLHALLDRHNNMIYTMFGHIGDGNLHIVPLMDLSDKRSRATIDELTHAVNKLVLKFNGSITAEHNDGMTRSPFLREMYGDQVYSLFEQTKHIFDPQNIFNPRKKIGADFSYALDHLKAETS